MADQPQPGRGRALLTGESIHVPDLPAASEDFPDGVATAQRLGHRVILATPLLRKGEAIDGLPVRRAEPRPFTHRQISLLSTFSDQAEIAIANARLFKEAQARNVDLRESLQQQTATADVLKVISRSAFDLRTALDALTESVTKRCGADL